MKSIQAFILSLWLLTFCSVSIAAGNRYALIADSARNKYSEDTYSIVSELTVLAMSLTSATELEKLEKVNAFVNQRMLYAEDIYVWNESDYWATTLESLSKKAGDCEDFSFAKYFILKSMNIPDERLKITYVKASVPGQGALRSKAHMVLNYYSTPKSDPLVLDNLVMEIKLASQRKDLFPVYSFNANNFKVGNDSHNVHHLNFQKWDELIARSHQEGF